MWEISNSGQGTAFLYAVCLGSSLCVLYDLFRLDRIVFKRGIVTVLLQDIFFFCVSSFSTFCLLLLTTNGQVRGFMIFGLLLGFTVCRFTLSKLIKIISPLIKRFVRKIRAIYSKAMENLSKIDLFAYNIIKVLLAKIKKEKKTPKNQKNNVKNSCNLSRDCV